MAELCLPSIAVHTVEDGVGSAGRVASGALRCVRLAGVLPHDALLEILDDDDAHPRRRAAYAGRV